MAASELRRRVRLVLTLAVAVGCLAWVLWDVDVDKVGEALREVQWSLIPLVLAPLAASFLLRTWRFQAILGPDRPSFTRQMEVSAVGFMAINLVPLRMGEFVRPWMLKEDGLSMGTSLAAVAAERVLDLLALLGLVMLVALSPDIPRGSIVVNGVDVITASQTAIGAFLVIAVGGLVGIGLGGSRAAALCERVPGIGPKLASFALSFRSTLASLVMRPLVGIAALVSSFVIWGGTIASAYALLVAFGSSSIEVSVTPTMAAATAVFTVAGAIAIPTPGSFGPFEVFCVAVLTVWQVDPDTAKTFALLWHLHIFAFNVLPGLALLTARGMGVGALVRQSRSGTPSGARAGSGPPAGDGGGST